MFAGSTNDNDDDDIYRQYAGSEAWLERDLAAQVGTLLIIIMYVYIIFIYL